MRADLVNPFIASLSELFSTMLRSRAECGKVNVTRDAQHPYGIVGLIDISGANNGTLAISFATNTALGIVGRLMGMEFSEVDDTVKDGLAEVVNIVAGGAKGRMNLETCEPMTLGFPKVATGGNYESTLPGNTIWLEVPFDTDFGPLIMGVTFEPTGVNV